MSDRHFSKMKCRNAYSLYIPIEVKNNRKRGASQIKILANSKAAPFNSYSNKSIKVTHKKK